MHEFRIAAAVQCYYLTLPQSVITYRTMKSAKRYKDMSEAVPSALDATLLTVEQLAHIFNMKRCQVYDLIRRTEIPHVRLSDNRIRFIWSDVSSWVKSRTVVRKMRR
jgi:excisionase family DNA binding protein